jgi:hypothetical protein
LCLAESRERDKVFTHLFHQENAVVATFRIVLGTLAFVALTLLPGMANAQQPLRGSTYGLKSDGSAFWPMRSNARRVEAARNYAYEFQTYVEHVQKPDPSVVKDVKTELGRYLEEGQKHLAAMKKEYAEDKATLAAIENIEKGLTSAIEHNKAMITCCENQKFDKVATMACCTDLVKQLEKVHADHVALMDKLAAAPAKK